MIPRGLCYALTIRLLHHHLLGLAILIAHDIQTFTHLWQQLALSIVDSLHFLDFFLSIMIDIPDTRGNHDVFIGLQLILTDEYPLLGSSRILEIECCYRHITKAHNA